ncbi:methionine--tRNA ligase [Poriferisphaera sp. WC338]|uniref:methionine--tRNA ligase n=1 Tax=Poriferisphaera sp. WC338 TaxID=3425129 RepID=UPI003D818156
MEQKRFYVTTPIYYVNDRPHIGHVYTTTIADVMARYHRMMGHDTFFLTGTDEHATKVVDAAAERGITTQQWADQNATAFQETFERLEMSNDDFIRTSQKRHMDRVTGYVQKLLDSGDVYLGDYEGWYDAGQEEYVPENKAKEYDFVSPVNGKPLVKKTEQNYFFKLSKYQDALLALLDLGEEVNGSTFDVQPSARKNEIVARVKEGLHDIPMTRTGMTDWGIKVPGDEEHTIYVWVDALFNYFSTVDTDDRKKYWPAEVHFIAKDILWFHAAIWPALLMALGEKLPKVVYSHSYWISEGQKMSKSLGNFIDLEKIDHYVETFSLDALRWFLATNGPMGTTDSDFAESKFIEVYNSDLANTFGNCASRISNMVAKYFDGVMPEKGPHVPMSDEYDNIAEQCVTKYTEAMANYQLAKAGDAAMELVRAVDSYIERTGPFKLAKDPEKLPEVASILYNCAEALRIASVMLWPFMPDKVQTFWSRIGFAAYGEALADKGAGQFEQWTNWGYLQPGTAIEKGDALFMRYQVPKK